VGSDAVKLYVREAALERSSAWAARAAASMDLDNVGLDSSSFLAGPLRGLVQHLRSKAAAEGNPEVSNAQCTLIREAVKEELNIRLSNPSASSKPATAIELVKNAATGVVHKASPRNQGELSSWVTVCGWRLAGASNAVLTAPEPGHYHQLLCEKCLPKERRAQRVAIQGAAERQIGVP
jgi:hypothetical protein